MSRTVVFDLWKRCLRKAALLGYPTGPGASDEQSAMAFSQAAGSTPGGGPVVGPGAAGIPCWLKQYAREP